MTHCTRYWTAHFVIAREARLSNIFVKLNSSTLKGRNKLHKELFSPFIVHPFFWKELVYRNATKKSQKLLPFEKMAETIPLNISHCKITNAHFVPCGLYSHGTFHHGSLYEKSKCLLWYFLNTIKHWDIVYKCLSQLSRKFVLIILIYSNNC